VLRRFKRRGRGSGGKGKGIKLLQVTLILSFGFNTSSIGYYIINNWINVPECPFHNISNAKVMLFGSLWICTRWSGSKTKRSGN